MYRRNEGAHVERDYVDEDDRGDWDADGRRHACDLSRRRPPVRGPSGRPNGHLERREEQSLATHWFRTPDGAEETAMLETTTTGG
jgi:hypothetical protein